MESEWEYLAEGRRSILLRPDKTKQEYKGMVLRLIKNEVDTPELSSIAVGVEVTIESRDALYARRVVAPWVGTKYIHTLNCRYENLKIPPPIPLTPDFVSRLSSQIQNRRPSGRMRANPVLRPIIGYFERDLTELLMPIDPRYSTIPSLNQDGVLCFEFKVKCGIKSSSPFSFRGGENAEGSLLKRMYSRYEIMQSWKMGGGGTSWTENGMKCKSEYDPNEFCSQNPQRVQRSLSQLLKNPQNNLRISFNGAHIFGWDKDTMDAAASLENHFNAFLSQRPVEASIANDKGSNSWEFIRDALSIILCSEDVLRRVQNLQALDIFDVEGASAIFSRLVDLVGSREAAVAEIESKLCEPIDIELQDYLEALTKGSLGDYTDSLQVDSSLSKVKTSWRLLKTLQVGCDTCETQLQLAYERAMSWLLTLDKEECIFFLRIWLLALMAKDVSVIVTMKLLCREHAGNYNKDYALRNHFVLAKHQTHEQAGILKLDGENSEILVYTITLVDVGPKDVSKIWQKAEEEEELCRRAWKTIEKAIEK